MKRLMIAVALLLSACCGAEEGCWDAGACDTDTDSDTDADAGQDAGEDAGDTDTESGWPYTCDPEDPHCGDCWVSPELGGPLGVCSPECDDAETDCPVTEYGDGVLCLEGHCFVWFDPTDGVPCPPGQEPVMHPELLVCWPVQEG